MTNADERLKVCFVITPFGAELRDYADQVFEFIVTEAAEQFGYQTVRADHIADGVTISPQIIQHLTQDGLVIADLTSQNPQVFYGLAIRHASRKPVIHLIRDGETPLSEFAGIPMVQVNLGSARDAKRCKQELASHIERIENEKHPQENPVSRAIKRQLIEQSESLLDQRAASMVKQLESLQTTITAIDERVSNPETFLPPELVKLLDGIRETVTNIDERIAQPDTVLPAEHLLNVIKGSGMLMNRDELEAAMSNIFSYAEDAKNTLVSLAPEMSNISKGLYSVGTTLSKQDPAKPLDIEKLAERVEQYASSAIHSQNALTEVTQKLDSALGALGQLYRSLSKLAL